ncbi:MAG TPA: Rrf2 family transcriptional regulator [Flavisolibacter sp.]|jgi:Rrf2 family protein|nr:Rrf2 family transcriptional regulator [Flavisolibacter sp.]
MIFSKSFGYAVRGVLYIAMVDDTRPFVQAEEIAEKLAVPRHFMGKILKKLAKAGVLSSSKGKTGGFALTPETESIQLIEIFNLTDGPDTFQNCSLRMQACHHSNPCPLHGQMEVVKEQLRHLLSNTTIGDLLKGDKADFLESITTHHQPFI